MNFKVGTLSRVSLCSLMVGLVGCGGGGGSDDTTSAASAAPTSCTQLLNILIPPTAIGLPTTGATVASSVAVAASGAGASATPAYCLVSGDIMPVDTTAPNIKFQLALPDAWNQKAIMLGGGGLNGFIPPVTANLFDAPLDSKSPLQKGYAVFASDSGHQDPTSSNITSTSTTIAAFAVNDEALANYSGDALKKTHDAAFVLIKAAYASTPKKSYFLGTSNGGKEALIVSGRWPSDWDGVVSLMPAQNWTPGVLSYLRAAKTFAAPGAFVSREKRSVLFRAALSACDGLDGVQDGLISDVQRCNAVFDPSTALLNGSPVRCAGGVDSGDNCLSDIQIAALKTVNGPLVFDFQMASGETAYPGWNVFTSDTGVSGDSFISTYVAYLSILGVSPQTFPVTSADLGLRIAEGWLRYAVARDPSFSYLNFDASNPGAYAARLSELSVRDVSVKNLTGFATKGGKLLLMHGQADLIINPRGTELYFQGLQSTMGAAQVDSFLRFYLVPGFGHSFSSAFFAKWDQLKALEDWVESGVDPKANQVVTDIVGVPGRTRPLCIYPTWPKYKGSGDVNQAASFSCTTS
ncbi:MAG: tannase/feruloyl esterase family alpha/beta hydrolase [Luteimonas sp.]|nr:tannase/feruloyl esterase family alpha/beta hydrolase [Luteimonas sp.]